MWSIGYGDHAGRQLADRLVPRIPANQEYGPLANVMGRFSALLEEIASSPNGCGSERENDGRFACVEKFLGFRGNSVAVLKIGKACGMRIRWPIALRRTQYRREQPKNEI